MNRNILDKSPFDYLIASLSPGATQLNVAFSGRDTNRPTSKTEVIRRYLREVGPATSADLAMEADVESSSLVSALLKCDLARGSVYRLGNKLAWNAEFDLAHEKEIRAAIALLRRSGYRVTQVNTVQRPARLSSKAITTCHAGRDGDCNHAMCPQLRDNEPQATGRHCPLDKV